LKDVIDIVLGICRSACSKTY